MPPSALVANASEAFGRSFQPMVVRFPQGPGWPATVLGREQRREQQASRPNVLTAYLDPPTGRVIEVVDVRSSLINVLHRFHENLTIPQYEGRAIVGWVGVAMLILSLSGIYLWWPRNAGFLRGLRWRRGPTVSSNLHHALGFWIAVPLAVVSATGIYLGFPQKGRELLSSVAPMTPQQRGAFNAPLMRQTNLNVDSALAAALATEPGARPAAIFMPTQQSQMWRVQLRAAQSDTIATVMVEDGSGATRKIVPLSGDRAAQWIRWIHEGSNSGPVWAILVFLCGLLPAVFAVTGVMIWLRSRKARKAGGPVRGVPQLDAAR